MVDSVLSSVSIAQSCDMHALAFKYVTSHDVRAEPESGLLLSSALIM